MFRGRLVATVFPLAPAVLLAAGCASHDSGTAPPPAASAPAATGTTLEGAPADAAGDRCRPATLRITVAGHDGPPGGQIQQTIDLTNSGPRPCTMAGYPGVDLLGATTDLDIAADGSVTVGAADPNHRWSLGRQSTDFAAVPLAPGATAHFVLTYLAGDPGADPKTMARGLSVREILVTPPDDTEHATLPWTAAVLLQDEATHPGTFIGPILPGA
jgi:hypothetical protein